MANILFIDLETTDSDVKRGGGIHQMAYVLDVDGKEVVRRNLKMAPHKNDLINAVALDVCKVTLEQIRAYPPPSEAFNQLVEDITPYRKVIISGFNSAIFDQPFFQSWWFKCRNETKRWDLDLLDFIHFDPLDVRVLALDYLLEIRDTLPSFKLGEVAKYFGITVDESGLHDASVDIDITRQIYYKIKAKDQTPFASPLQDAVRRLGQYTDRDKAIEYAKGLSDAVKTDAVFRRAFTRKFK